MFANDNSTVVKVNEAVSLQQDHPEHSTNDVVAGASPPTTFFCSASESDDITFLLKSSFVRFFIIIELGIYIRLFTCVELSVVFRVSDEFPARVIASCFRISN
jgi:hypothetical protein